MQNKKQKSTLSQNDYLSIIRSVIFTEFKNSIDNNLCTLEDMISIAWLKLPYLIKKFDGRGKEEGWIYFCTKRIILDYIKKAKKQPNRKGRRYFLELNEHDNIYEMSDSNLELWLLAKNIGAGDYMLEAVKLKLAGYKKHELYKMRNGRRSHLSAFEYFQKKTRAWVAKNAEI